MVNNLSVVIKRSITGFISFVELEFKKIFTVMELPFNFQFATQGVKIYNACPQEIFPDM
jgi:hypothetical protein